MKSLIALDIDGTITDQHHEISPHVIDFFVKLHEEGHQLAFITGRTFYWGYSVLQHLPIPYYFGVQNGAIILGMPERAILVKRYLDPSIFTAMEKICENEATDFVIYSGYEDEDRCYYRPERFQDQLRGYVERRIEAIGEAWLPVKSYADLPVATFASVKCFGDYESALRISQAMERELSLHAPIVKDPYSSKHYVIQGTLSDVSKGGAVRDIKSMCSPNIPVIAGGDDLNDASMLEEADIKIVMSTAPESLLRGADVIAPPASSEGIIEGINHALQILGSR